MTDEQIAELSAEATRVMAQRDRAHDTLRRVEPYLVARLKQVESAIGIEFDAEVVARVRGDLAAVRAALGQQ